MYHPHDGQREAPSSNPLPHDGQLSGSTIVAILQGVATGTGIPRVGRNRTRRNAASWFTTI
jgi:hypothetical protein